MTFLRKLANCTKRTILTFWLPKLFTAKKLQTSCRRHILKEIFPKKTYSQEYNKDFWRRKIYIGESRASRRYTGLNVLVDWYDDYYLINKFDYFKTVSKNFPFGTRKTVVFHWRNICYFFRPVEITGVNSVSGLFSSRSLEVRVSVKLNPFPFPPGVSGAVVNCFCWPRENENPSAIPTTTYF